MFQMKAIFLDKLLQEQADDPWIKTVIVVIQPWWFWRKELTYCADVVQLVNQTVRATAGRINQLMLRVACQLILTVANQLIFHVASQLMLLATSQLIHRVN
jgi:hypothetical protein